MKYSVPTLILLLSGFPTAAVAQDTLREAQRRAACPPDSIVMKPYNLEIKQAQLRQLQLRYTDSFHPVALLNEEIRVMQGDRIPWQGPPATASAPFSCDQAVGVSAGIQGGAQDLAQLLEQQLYPPELIMQNQSRLQITEAQRTVITAEISKLQAAAVQMQWRVAEETQKLVEQLRQPTVSEEQALAQIDRLIALEAGVKRAQLAMLIRIRNVLTPAQRDMLRDARHPPSR